METQEMEPRQETFEEALASPYIEQMIVKSLQPQLAYGPPGATEDHVGVCLDDPEVVETIHSLFAMGPRGVYLPSNCGKGVWKFEYINPFHVANAIKEGRDYTRVFRRVWFFPNLDLAFKVIPQPQFRGTDIRPGVRCVPTISGKPKKHNKNKKKKGKKK